MSDPAKYRTKEELEEYKAKDPIEQVRQLILDKKIAKEADLEKIDDKIKDQVAEAVQFSEDSGWPDPSESLKDVYAQQDYPYLME